MFEMFSREMIYLVLLLFFILYVIIFTIARRKITLEINFEDKKELIEKINILLFKIGYHIESEKEDLITYKYFYARVAVSFRNNTATVIAYYPIIRKLKKMFNIK